MDFNKLAIVLNTVVTPLLNPIIYSFRNKVVKDVVRDSVKRIGATFVTKAYFFPFCIVQPQVFPNASGRRNC